MDGHVLSWDRRHLGAELTVRPADGHTGATGACTTFHLQVHHHRLQIELALLPTARTVDISLQPGILAQVVPGCSGPCRAGTAGAIVAGWIAALVGPTRAWRPDDPVGLGPVGTVGGAALPFLGAAYDRGAVPLVEVPPWAGPVLGGDSPLGAARAGFGRSGTRSVARALAGRLVVAGPGVPPGVERMGPDRSATVALFPLAAALMGEGTLEPDQLARVLGAGGPSHPPGCWPDRGRIAVGRAVAERLGPAGAERVLVDAVVSADGPSMLAEVCRLFPSVADRIPARPAHRLGELRDQCRNLLPIDPDPRAGGWSRPRPSPSPRLAPRRPVRTRTPPIRQPVSSVSDHPVVERRQADPRARALIAPSTPTVAVTPNEPLPYAPHLAAVHGADCGDDLRLVLPRTTDELAAWGRRLRSCIGSFGPAVVSGRSVLVGVEQEGALVYCLEVTADGTVRQFLGERNRTVPRTVATAVCSRLVVLGVLRSDGSANRLWLEA